MAEIDENCLLKISNSERLNKFLHACVDDLIGKKQESFDNYNSDIEWTKGEDQRARNLIQNLYKQNVFNEEFTPNFKELSLKDTEQIKECFNIRKSEIHQAVIKESLLKSGVPLVENIDWKLKWVMGSSKLASISEPLLQLDLHCLREGDAEGRSTVNCELNLEQLDCLIQELESVNSIL